VSGVRVVLDTSAVLAFAHGSIDVGEVLAEVDDEDASFAVPIVCVIEAAARLGDDAMVRVLVQRPACVVTPLRRDDWRVLARDARILGRLDLAVVALTAADAGAHILTGEPDAYGDEAPVIPI
jgi:hypothetical protein